MMKEGIRGLRPSYKNDPPGLRTSVGGAQAAIESKFFELEQGHCTIFHVKLRAILGRHPLANVATVWQKTRPRAESCQCETTAVCT